MRLFTIKIFQGFIQGPGSTVHTDAEHIDVLGMADELKFSVYSEQVVGTNPNVNVFVEESNDGRNWADRSTAPQISNGPLVNGGVLFGYIASPPPPAAYVRLRMTLLGSAPGPSAQIWIAATGRGHSR